MDMCRKYTVAFSFVFGIRENAVNADFKVKAMVFPLAVYRCESGP